MFSEKVMHLCSDHKVVQTVAFQQASFKGFDNLITHAAEYFLYCRPTQPGPVLADKARG